MCMKRLMNLMKNLALGVGLMMTALLSNAAEIWHTSTIRVIYPLADGSFILVFNANSVSCSSASNPHYYYATVGQNGLTAEGSKKMYALATLAFATNKPISFAFDNATPNCYINRLHIGSA